MDIKSIATWNAAGLSTEKKRNWFDNLCHSNNISFCAIQESNLKMTRYDLLHGTIIGMPSKKAHAGLSFWVGGKDMASNLQLKNVVQDVVLECILELEGRLVVLYNLHLPQKDQEAIDALKTWCERLEYWGAVVPRPEKERRSDKEKVFYLNLDKEPGTDNDAKKENKPNHQDAEPCFIILGDLNVELERVTKSSRQWKKLAVKDFLFTIFSALNVNPISVSTLSNVPQGTRGDVILDYVCLPKTWNMHVKSLEIINVESSDHAVVITSFTLGTKFTHPPYWRFKNGLLDHTGFVKSMKIFLEERLTDCPENKETFFEWWDSLKKEIIELSKECWKKCEKEKRKKERIDLNHKTDNFVNTGKGTWTQPDKIIFVKNKAGKIVEEKKEVVEVLETFFSELYAPSHEYIRPDVNMSFGLKKIDASLLPDLEEEITLEETWRAAASMNPGKAPGIDGITLEFYLKFWDLLGPFLLYWFQAILEQGTLSGSSSIGVLTLIKKKGDHRNIENWRPITLLTVELKIFAKVLAKRIGPAVASVIPQEQAAIPGRSILEPLATIRDIITLKSKSAKPFYILSLDQSKAFDRVSHTFLFHLLKVIGLPQLMLDSLKALYTNFVCVVKNVDTLTKPFIYGRGIRQGDATSSILYALSLQPVLNALHLVCKEDGFKLTEKDLILTTAYADDVSVFLSSPDSVRLVLKTFEMVARYSGALVNLSKSNVFGINIETEKREAVADLLAPLQINFDKVIILGIPFTTCRYIDMDYWNTKIRASKEKVAAATSFLIRCTFLDRVLWVKRKLWPSWTYLLKTLQPTQVQVQQLTSLLSEAVWLGGKHWLSTSEIAADKKKGGLQAVLPRDKIDTWRVCMLAKLWSLGASSQCFRLAECILNQYADLSLGFNLLHTKPEKHLLCTLPPVYAVAFKAWDRLQICFLPSCEEELLDMPVMNSRFLLQEYEPINISCSLAKTMKIKTIRDGMKFVPGVTRFSVKLVENINKAVNEWKSLSRQTRDGDTEKKLNLESKIECKNMVNKHFQEGVNLQNTNQSKIPQVGLILDDKIVPIETWSNKLIGRVFMEDLELERNPEVPKETWSVLFSAVAPAVFINHGWRFMHKCNLDASFYSHLNIRTTEGCILCNSKDVSVIHQFRNCNVLEEAMETLNTFIVLLEIPPLANHWQLYSEPTDDHRLGNFIVLAFLYTVVLASRSAVNSGVALTKFKLNQIFFMVILKHLKIYANKYPPKRKDLRNKWSVYCNHEILAKFKGDDLFLNDQGVFIKFEEQF